MISFNKGEERYVYGSILPEEEDELVVITSATYTVECCRTKECLQEGSCEINGDTLRLLLNCNKEGTYKIIVTARVGKEVIVRTELVEIKDV